MNNKQSDNKLTSKSEATICKLGIDVHAKSIMVTRQLDGLNPQPPQRFAVGEILPWVRKLLDEGHRVYSCYEAGPTGYWLHRKLTEMGVVNYVVCPTRLDSRGKGVNTDKTDATELLVRLDRYLAGNKKAMAVVTVPTVEQERKRLLSRQREQLRRKRLSFAAQGRMLLLSQGYREGNNWWRPVYWQRLKGLLLEENLQSALECLRRLIQAVDLEVEGLTKVVVKQAPACLPKGMGELTHEILDREIKGWDKFKNRRQVGSYSGLTGGVSGSGEKSADLSITKAGNRRVSSCLIECAWRILLYQPNYWLVKKWSAVLLNRKTHARRRKQAIVAFARQLLVDIWKWKTSRTTPEKLGWIMVQKTTTAAQ
jgi:transposase